METTERPDGAQPRRSGIQVIARAGAILRALEEQEDGLSLGQIAARVNLPRSTVQRIIAALEEEGFVMSASPTSGVRLGPAILRLANSARIDIAKVAHPYLCELSKAINETVDFSVLVGSRSIFVDQVVGSQELKAEFPVGQTLPLHCSAHGKALLAAVDRERAFGLAKKELGSDQQRINELMVELEEIKETGVSLDCEGHAQGICALGSAVIDTQGNVGAVSIPVPSQRFEVRKDALFEELLACCGKINHSLGRGRHS